MEDRRRPPETAADPLSDLDINKDKKTDVELVFEHWKKAHNHTKAQLDDKRRKLIRDALKLYSAQDLMRCIDGYKRSAWHMGQNDRKKKFDGIEIFLRDAKHIDDGLEFGTASDPRFKGAK
jgi:hypothetical protein